MELSDATEKFPATPEIDPGTFRLVAQCLNHYATPGPALPLLYIYISILFIKYLLQVRHILQHPQGELFSLAQNCLLIVMLLHRLQNIIYIICEFYNVIYNY